MIRNPNDSYLKYHPIDFKSMLDTSLEVEKHLESKLKLNLCIPSVANAYSTCIEYVREWFMSGFYNDYFKSEYIEYKHVFDDTRRMSKMELMKRNKPALTIIPRIDESYNRENLDLYNYGTNLYYNRCRFQDSFFRNFETDTYISLAIEMLKMDFTFKIKVSNMSHAQDLKRYMSMKFRNLGTQGKYADMDFHVPMEIIHKIAEENCFEIDKDGKVKDLNRFMYFINSHSSLPFLLKFRSATNTYEYFIKVPKMYIHIKTNSVEMDEGERQGHLLNNYVVTMEIEVRFPQPKFYAYYSLRVYGTINSSNIDGSYTMYNFPMGLIPSTNEKGWGQYLDTTYILESLKNENEVIYFNEIMGDLRRVIEATKAQYLSPSIFCDIKLFNSYKEIPIDVDWSDLSIHTKEILKDCTSTIVIYVDLAYLNTTMLEMKDSVKERINFDKAKTVREV